MVRVVIVTALPLEAAAVLARLHDKRRERHATGTQYTVGWFDERRKDWEIAVCISGPGNVSAAQEAERAAEMFDPQVMLFSGVAGGRKDVKLGDVVFASKIYGYESAKAGVDGLEPRPDVVPASYRLHQVALHETIGDDWCQGLATPDSTAKPRALVKPVASGEKLVGSAQSDVAKMLGAAYGDAVAIEMEGHGFLKSISTRPSIQAGVVRGISDLLDNKAVAEQAGSQEMAARNAAAFCFHLLSVLDAPSSTERELPPTLQALKSDARNLAVQRPKYWGVRLFSQVLADEIAAASSLKWKSEHGISFDVQHIESIKAITWFRERLTALTRITLPLTPLFNKAIKQAIHGDGGAGDPEHVVYCAQMVAEAYRRVIDWRTSFNQITVDEPYYRLRELVRVYSDTVISGIEQFSQDMQSKIDDVVADRIPEGTKTIALNLHLDAPDEKPLLSELERLQAALGIIAETTSGILGTEAEKKRQQFRFDLASELREHLREKINESGGPLPPNESRLPDAAAESVVEALRDERSFEDARKIFETELQKRTPGVLSSFVSGIAAAIFGRALAKYKLRSKTVEAAMNVRKLYDSAISFYIGNPKRKLDSVGWTPDESQKEKNGQFPVRSDFWQHPTWKALNFSVDDPFYYSYRFEATPMGFKVFARGDLDRDGQFSLFWREGVFVDGKIQSDGLLHAENEID